ncbi:MAG: TOBE domain-containing protein, partial [Gammaproteobacteria bacterium]|nr:TOBE domain-containing protein [Gammaproteobacteria bacterium]
VLPYLERLRDELRVPILYVSHALSEISRIADTIVLVSDGRVVTGGPVSDVLARADLFPLTGRHEAGAVIDAIVEGHDERYELTELSCAGGRLRVPRLAAAPGTRLRVRVRARDVILATEPPRGLSTQTVLEGVVAPGDTGTGAIVDLPLDCGGAALIARVTRRSVETLGLSPGRKVWALVKTVAFDRRSLGHAPPAAEDSMTE